MEEENILRTEIPRLQLTQHAFRCKTVSRWNNLPIGLGTELRLKTFKKALKVWLKDRRTVDREMEPD